MTNSLITTKDIGIIESNDIVVFEDSVQSGYDYDFYFSVLGGDSLYTWITLDDFDDDLDLSLYKRNESNSYEFIISSENSDASYESIFNALAEGDYIASVQFYEDLDSDTSPSTFSLEFDTKSFNENSVLPNDTYFNNQWSLFNT
ncbi:hypothetical protein N9025_03495, partial [Synechococcus sp. AH-707-B22]|nr:hypothetical protein [Synechococcus sp. AH-707-B22]